MLRIMAVGASAGGLEALQDLLSNLQVLDNCCVIIAQHMSPTHRSMLVQLLTKATSFPVVEATNLQALSEKTIFITPPDTEISIRDEAIHLAKPHSSIGPKPSVDVLFESLAKEDNQVIAIILSGTGSDGAEGINRLAMSGDAFILAQDPSSAKYDGMPNAAIQTGHVKKILSAKDLGKHLSDLLASAESKGLFRSMDEKKSAYDKVVELLSKKSGTDFSNYKTASFTRRLEKRISSLHMDSLERYLEYLEENPEEVNELFNMVFIGVTSFFRDSEAFLTLETYLDRLVQGKKSQESIRIWIPGCSTGEEAYSIAILLHKMLKRYAKEHLEIQLFATDIDEQAIAQARSAFFPADSLQVLSRETIEQYFIPKGSGYEVIKAIRSMVLFSKHDIMRNPPFLKLDLISCRNLLIYFKNSLQQQLIPLFHFALLPGGYLFLGKSESIGPFTSLFAEENTKHRIYKKKISQGLQTIRFSALKPQTMPVKQVQATQNPPANNLKESARKTLLKALDTPYVVVNETQDIQEVHGDVRLFLSLSEGGIQANLIKMLNPELQIEVRAILNKCIKSNTGIKSKIKKFRLFDSYHYVRVGVFPLIDQPGSDPLYMVLFEKLDLEDFIHSDPQSTALPADESTKFKELEEELNETKEQLQTYIEEIETSNEELQSLIEELQSTNEELQSANEELETTNEELQSTNEEIQVAYMELKSAHETLEAKELELQVLQANSEALLDNDLQAFILVDSSYKIQKFNHRAVELFEDLSGKRLATEKLILDYLPEGETEHFITNFKKVLDKKAFTGEKNFTDLSGKNRWFAVNYAPVIFKGESVTGVSLSLLDITTLKDTQSSLVLTEKLVSAVFNVVSLGICVTDESGILLNANDAYCELYGYEKHELVGEHFTKVVPVSQKEQLSLLHDQFINTGSETLGEARVISKAGVRIDVEVTADLLIQPDGTRYKVTSVKDITQQKNIKKLLAEAQNMARIGAWEYVIDTGSLNYSEITSQIYGIPDSFELTVENGLSFYQEGSSRNQISQAFKECMEQGRPFDMELVLVDFNGVKKWVRSIGRAEKSDDSVVRIFGSIQDITDKKEAEERIKETNQRFSYVTQATSDVIWDWDITRDKVLWGENHVQIFGELPSENLSDVAQVHRRLDPDELEQIIQDAEEVLRSDRIQWQCEHRYLKSDGSYAVVSNKALIIRNNEGKPVRVIGAMQDITKRHYQELERKMQREISLIFNKGGELVNTLSEVIQYLADLAAIDLAEVWLVSPDNTSIKLLANYSQTEQANLFRINSQQITTFQKGEGLPGNVWTTGQSMIWDQVEDHKEFVRSKAAKKSGIIAVFGVPLQQNGDMLGVLVFGSSKGREHLESFKMLFGSLESFLSGELMRKKLESELTQIIEGAPDLIGIVNFEGHFIKINEAASRMLEYSMDELMSLPFLDLVHPDDHYKTEMEFNRLINEAIPLAFENRYLAKSGKSIWISWSSRAIPEERIIYAFGKDVTRQKSLLQSLENAYEQAMIGVWETNVGQEITYWSGVARKIHEISDTKFIPSVQEALLFYREDYRSLVSEMVGKCLATGELFDFEAPIITATGNEKWVRATGQAEIQHGKVTKMYGSIQDIHARKTAEQQMLIFKQIVETSHEGIAVAGLEGQVNYLNPSFSQKLGFTTQELQDAGGPPAVYAEQEVAAEVFGHLLRGKPWKGDIYLVDKTGKRTPYFLSAGPIYDEKGTLIAVFGIHTDISERIESETALKRNLQALEDYKFALDQAVIVAITDVQGKITSVNQKFCEISKYTPEELIGKTHQIVNSGYHPKSFFNEMWKKLTKGQVWQGVIKNRAKDGSEYWVNSTMVPFLDENGRPSQFLALRFEVTEQILATEELKIANRQLESLNESLKERAQELAISNAELEQFAYVASHDLQEPLRMITSFLAQLNKKYGELFDDRAKEYIGFALDGASRMRQIILDLLEFSRVGKNDERLGPVSLAELVAEVILLNRKAIEESNAKIHIGELPTIQNYRTPLMQVFNNLIGNALKYRKKTIPPSINVSCTENENSYTIRVSDNGIGIEEEYFQKIFVIFQRLHHKTEYSGTGIGLAIVKKIIENLGGHVWVKSKKDEGSTFYFTLLKTPVKPEKIKKDTPYETGH
ncbi:Chemotaxis protein methyltransferase CheR [Lunatimonas lonarensis]|uniref:Chemotaxis protein methyltransferase CheR n=1 Tax=Lunatimonas lonarensis TaxID=1232681 RepID=R7ZNZ3_9BACT|nr:PAS domain S-box protein [Lunatimonas lonarensis]EON75830.1 Chemotaxis protein methyltransferase CheR [Lunatimonas lonarensis]